ncbi:MAG: hypothetical protein QF673_01605 [Candidatus Hydrothermarchaeota archaeon]|jgi:hypothetical protein|nr:hypothetical protein [Candidatus Hydrothermarchaeota archaeon]MDP6612696.1 hypothetical protein [Candidatus Hydrothermarchaeota archaeon]
MVLECPKNGQKSLKYLLISYPSCGSEIEMLSDEETATCVDCDTEVRNEEI